MLLYNPLERFVGQMIPGFLEMKRVFLVAQSYPRGRNPLEDKPQPSLLLCDYASPGAAQAHLGGIRHDEWAALIQLESRVHREKLEEMAAPGSGYLLYAAFVRDAKKVNLYYNRHLAEAIREYIRRETSWQPGRGEILRPNLELVFGELFVRLSFQGQVLKERLEEFEKVLSPCVTISPSPPVSGSYRIIFQGSSLIRN